MKAEPRKTRREFGRGRRGSPGTPVSRGGLSWFRSETGPRSPGEGTGTDWPLSRSGQNRCRSAFCSFGLFSLWVEGGGGLGKGREGGRTERKKGSKEGGKMRLEKTKR